MFERAVSTRHFGSRDRRLKAKDFMLKEQPKFAVYHRNYGIRSFFYPFKVSVFISTLLIKATPRQFF